MRKVNIYKHYQLYEDGRCYSLRSERFLSPTKSQHGVWRYAFTINRVSTARSIAVLLNTYFGNYDAKQHRIKYVDKNNYRTARVLTIQEYNKENHNKKFSLEEAQYSECKYAKRFYRGDKNVLGDIYQKLCCTANECFTTEILHVAFLYTIERMKEYNKPMTNTVGYIQTVAKFRRYANHKRNISIEKLYKTPEGLRTECLSI